MVEITADKVIKKLNIAGYTKLNYPFDSRIGFAYAGLKGYFIRLSPELPTWGPNRFFEIGPKELSKIIDDAEKAGAPTLYSYISELCEEVKS